MPLPVPNHMLMDLQTMIFLSYKVYCTFTTITFIGFLSITEHSQLLWKLQSTSRQQLVKEKSPSPGLPPVVVYPSLDTL